MPCQYCRQPIPKDKLYCPHCGAANPNYEDEKSQTSSTIINNNVTINVNSPKNKKDHPNIRENEKQQEVVKPQSSTTNKCASEIKLTIFCTICTSLVLAAVYTAKLNHNVSFLLIFLLFFIGGFFVNILIVFAAKDLGASKKVSVLLCVVCMIIGCGIISNKTKSVNESYDKTHNFQEFSSKSQRTTENYNKSQYSASETKTVVKNETLPEKPQDGMTFAQLKKQRWGYKFLYTKCRDFDHLRPNKRYYEVVWYNSDLKRIGDGILCCQDEDDDTAILANFRDYTE